MGQKMCKGDDKPWVTLKCIFVNKSTNVDIGDYPDGAIDSEEIENTSGCCLLQCLRRKRRRETMEMQ
jgi:hypothetical protein